jgi:ribose/xylose/arabinose/galactoside ABC-type transport system permease subunit
VKKSTSQRLTLSSGSRLGDIATRNALLVGLVAMMAFFATQSSFFLTVDNFRDVGVQSAILSVVAVTSALLLLAGYVDLSVGSNMAVSAIVTALLIVESNWNPFAAAVIGVLVGLVLGGLNGALVTFAGFSPIIVTLGTLTAYRGIALLISDAPVFGFGEGFAELGRGRVGGVPYLLVIAAAFFLGGAFALNYTARGRHIYAIGSSREAAFLAGLPIRGLPFALYLITGASAGLAGVMSAARLDSVPPGSLGVGFELDVLTAVLLGGVSFAGGRGNIRGVFLGIVFLGVLFNGLVLMNVSPFVALVVKGLALVAAAALDWVSTRLDAER